jgi:hypothetical protein
LGARDSNGLELDREVLLDMDVDVIDHSHDTSKLQDANMISIHAHSKTSDGSPL